MPGGVRCALGEGVLYRPFLRSDTDYATYIRLERGEVSSKTAPVPGTEPRELTGDIWWSPDGFCGKLRHAKYSRVRIPVTFRFTSFR